MKPKIKQVDVPFGHVPKLKMSYDRLFTPQVGAKPRLPARISLELIRCMDDLNIAYAQYMQAVQRMTAQLAPDVEAIRKAGADLSDEKKSFALVVVDISLLDEWQVQIDPEAVYILRAHGLLEDRGEPVAEPEFLAVED